jgi:hypothetical protein
MDFSRFCTFSGEDFTPENHEFVSAGRKEYLCENKNFSSSHFYTSGNLIRRFVGICGQYSLVSVNTKVDDVL